MGEVNGEPAGELTVQRETRNPEIDSVMATPNVLILRAPGTNCDVETGYAFELAGAKAERVHINRLLEDPR